MSYIGCGEEQHACESTGRLRAGCRGGGAGLGCWSPESQGLRERGTVGQA